MYINRSMYKCRITSYSLEDYTSPTWKVTYYYKDNKVKYYYYYYYYYYYGIHTLYPDVTWA